MESPRVSASPFRDCAATQRSPTRCSWCLGARWPCRTLPQLLPPLGWPAVDRDPSLPAPRPQRWPMPSCGAHARSSAALPSCGARTARDGDPARDLRRRRTDHLSVQGVISAKHESEAIKRLYRPAGTCTPIHQPRLRDHFQGLDELVEASKSEIVSDCGSRREWQIRNRRFLSLLGHASHPGGATTRKRARPISSGLEKPLELRHGLASLKPLRQDTERQRLDPSASLFRRRSVSKHTRQL
jgi:hypothetical protein